MKSSRIRRMKEFKPNGQSIFWITGRIRLALYWLCSSRAKFNKHLFGNELENCRAKQAVTAPQA
jgi:hypothetical protein